MSGVAPVRLPVASGGETARGMRVLARGHRLAIAVVFVVGILGAASGLLIPIAIGYLVDGLSSGDATVGTLGIAAALMVGATVLNAVLAAISVRLAARTYHTLLAKLRETLFTRALGLRQHTVERAGTGDLISRSSDDVSEIGNAATELVPALTSSVFAVIVTLVGLAALDWPYLVVVLAMLPIHAIAVRWYLRTAPKVYGAERAAMSTRAQQILESQRGYSTVAGFGAGLPRHHRVLEASWGVVGHSLRARTVQNMFLGRLFGIEYLGLGVVLVVAYFMVGTGRSTVGAATAATLILMRLFTPINQLLMAFDTMQSVLASLSRIVGVITMRQPVDSAGDGDGGGAIRVDDLEFGYGDGPTVLDGVTLSIPEGQRVAVVGASGAGKTSLTSVIAGIHPPRSGTVRRPTRTALITQETHVFAGTVRDNLTLVDETATDDELHAALAAIGADSLVSTLPDGLDTRVGGRAHELTPAQTQHLALARLMLADPDVAILDEATAEAGSTQAGQLDAAADTVLSGRTGIVIAHRLSQAAECDRILVMDDGRIIEDGDHETLLAAGGMYARLWTAWARDR
ncbi:ABC transporter ATP-binding protein [Tsukamurella sp. 8F]|uniref:ABC transporter ATP-binding protein n=1 Tax=unclassified Tsukamurella TaxID=2633480 RepID=UPI0023B954AA|nr:MULTISPECIES: ABC transporter ATP-binding protein [unclassified Tsukamurella]MDF0531161.1 ABC transporter ATP-binding protein [Tsukamurella sp. 8J]MDF0585892.1 ABC transporter ATP-binding protein [Tsukamurella sp. 8F]